jgi:hypothetical protein
MSHFAAAFTRPIHAKLGARSVLVNAAAMHALAKMSQGALWFAKTGE